MKTKSFFFVHAVVSAAIASASISALAVDAFDPATNVLTLESVSVGGTIYKNVAVQINGYSNVSIRGGAPAPTSFDPATNLLQIGSLAFQGAVYNNVQLTVGGVNIISAGNAPTPGNLGGVAYAGNEQAGYVRALNAARTACGIPAVAQNTVLDSAANVQWTGAPGFTGGGPTPALGDNVKAAQNAGYLMADSVGNVHSNMVAGFALNETSTDQTERTNVGSWAAQVAMSDASSLLTVMRPYTEVGSYYVRQLGIIRTIKAVFGNPQERRTVQGTVVTYPCANTTAALPQWIPYGQTNVSYISAPPASNLVNLSYVPNFNGTPIAVFANAGEKLVLTNASLTLKGGAGVPIELWDATKPGWWTVSDKSIRDNEGVIVPKSFLRENSEYDVVIFGTVNGAAWTRSFTFRTGTPIPIIRS